MNRLLALFAFAALALAPHVRAAEYPTETGEELAHTFPYSMIGQLLFLSGGREFSGSGTVIRPSSVFTAAHNLYDYRGGWSTDVRFRRGQNGDSVLSRHRASKILVFGGYREVVAARGSSSVRAFARDIGGVRFSAPVANGGFAGWIAKPSLLTSGVYNAAYGYGGEFHSGNDLLQVTSRRPFQQVYGAFYENLSVYYESGMSGGPVFAQDTDNELYVAAVVVSGSFDPDAGGARVINGKAATFIQEYLR